ncbi:MAG: CYTH domain-containing protein [Sphingobacteriia bacterium]|nr:CYTH domain-containing protein [Sphingobacteriia bacterium]NCC37876.1 CYTH domain-containing protein [Gammaproteobacteria bacterium]
MAVEIERKFLVEGESWRAAVERRDTILQGYLVESGPLTLRVRVKGGRGFLTIKGATTGVSRIEYEYEIPLADAREMLETLTCLPVIEKVRHLVRHGEHLWEIDVFAGANAGLVLAEIELTAEDESFDRPDWAGPEVSDDPRYFNRNLASHPYTHW